MNFQIRNMKGKDVISNGLYSSGWEAGKWCVCDTINTIFLTVKSATPETLFSLSILSETSIH